ncbi:MAG: metal-chelation protein CHAD [Gammaproteobacteria bacterium]|jgi:CHAD domain-containing protein|nr:metal-chelation protein CHAD [Gammaproteobacteria bacterium]|tara:strand:- start:8 stop:1582 length:1575 start_codon:yes stop_codon:yes gene_type:complete
MRIEFIVPVNQDIEQLKSSVQENFSAHLEPVRTVYRTHYDSFDWRLYKKNSLLEDTRDGNEHILVWKTLQGENYCPRMKLREIPQFAWDLPKGPFRDLLTMVLEMRELTPRVRVRSKIHVLRILNKDEKTVSRLIIQENNLQRQRGIRSGKIDNRATIVPVRGYAKPSMEVARFLEQQGLIPTQDDLMMTALTTIGASPGDYSTKLLLTLDPTMRADRTMKIILRRLFDIMLVNEDGTRTGTDTEFLHDFRVAIRRTRSALSQVKAVFPKQVLDRYKREFAWLGQITSPGRDLDVYLLNFDEYRDNLPAGMQAHIEPMRDFLIKQQGIEHKALIKAMNSQRYRRILLHWPAFLDEPVKERSTLKNARQPIINVARKRIWRIYRGILRNGGLITPGTPAEVLHDLRKDCKKLRYMMEFFRSLFAEEHIEQLTRMLKSLQTNLGNHQDYDVQIKSLNQIGSQMQAEGNATPETLLAMAMLIEGLQAKLQQTRSEFAIQFGTFAAKENRKLFRKLFANAQESQKILQ